MCFLRPECVLLTYMMCFCLCHCAGYLDLDWELTDSLEGPGGRRLVEVALVKSTMRDDMIHWWKQVFQGDPEIDTQKIKGRTSGFQDAWKEAQARFMESVKEKQPLVL